MNNLLICCNVDCMSSKKLYKTFISGAAIWQTTSSAPIIDFLDTTIMSGIQKLYPVLKSLADKTEVVLMLPGPIKELNLFDQNNEFCKSHSL